VLAIQYYLAAHLEHHGLFTFFGWVFVPCALVFIMVFAQERTDGFLKELGAALAGFMITIYAPSHLAHFFALPSGANETGAAGFVLFVIALTQWNDVAQYCCGKLFGKRKIVPKVSPNKTWGGFLGGILLTMGASVLIAPYLTPFSMLQALAIGAIIAPLGFLGDVFISAIKRDLGIKDTGAFLPGHGGILDRIDSLILVAPVYFHLVYYFVYMKGGFICSVVL
jgi:phosphatidate cytidylyltransferase